MEKKSSFGKILILTILIIILFIFFIKNVIPRREKKEKLPEFNPYEGEFTVQINPISSLNKKSLKEIAAFRIEKVKEYSFLNIFPEDYNPLIKKHKEIFGRITPYADWLEPAQFYICNPYMLVVLTCAGHVTPLVINCFNSSIEYSYRTIIETHKGEDANRWFNELYSHEKNKGLIRIWTVNASDAYLFYANVDKNQSENIDYDWHSVPQNIINSPYEGHSYFHLGHYNVNNLSFSDQNAWIKLRKKDVYTKIYIKLWRNRPKSINDKEDMAYIVEIKP